MMPHWIKEINAVFIKAVSSNGEIFKVLFSKKKVPGSFTGEALGTEMIKETLSIKALQGKNAVDGIKNSNTLKYLVF